MIIFVLVCFCLLLCIRIAHTQDSFIRALDRSHIRVKANDKLVLFTETDFHNAVYVLPPLLFSASRMHGAVGNNSLAMHLLVVSRNRRTNSFCIHYHVFPINCIMWSSSGILPLPLPDHSNVEEKFSLGQWQEKSWRAGGWIKTILLHKAVHLGYSALFLDTDILILNSFISYFNQSHFQEVDVHLSTRCGGGGIFPLKNNVNLGVVLIKPTIGGIQYIDFLYRRGIESNWTAWDQGEAQGFLETNSTIKAHYLDKHVFSMVDKCGEGDPGVDFSHCGIDCTEAQLLTMYTYHVSLGPSPGINKVEIFSKISRRRFGNNSDIYSPIS